MNRVAFQSRARRTTRSCAFSIHNLSEGSVNHSKQQPVTLTEDLVDQVAL